MIQGWHCKEKLDVVKGLNWYWTVHWMYKLRKLFGITSYELFRKKLLCVLDHDYNSWCVLLPSECSFNWATENLLQFRQNSGYKIVLSTLHKVKERQKILEQKNVSYPWDQVCWFVFDASCIDQIRNVVNCLWAHTAFMIMLFYAFDGFYRGMVYSAITGGS